MTPDTLARACADRMWADDQASPGLGMRLEEVGPGWARLSLMVTAGLLNGHRTCHGGYIFSLADSAFAFACNSEDQAAVASHCAVSFLRPAREGEELVAHAERRAEAGRSGIYDVRVATRGGETVAEFRGHSRTIGRSVLPGTLPEASDAA